MSTAIYWGYYQTFCGNGFSINENVGIYVLNSALFSCGGAKDDRDEEIDDFGKLAVETRRLNEWVQNSTHNFRILAMHHPLEWMKGWAQKELEGLTRQHFDVVLCGHTHEGRAQELFNGTESCLICIAPPLFTRKSELLGYSVLNICDSTKSIKIKYRQWHSGKFLPGVMMARTEDGVISFGSMAKKNGELSDQTSKTEMLQN